MLIAFMIKAELQEHTMLHSGRPNSCSPKGQTCRTTIESRCMCPLALTHPGLVDFFAHVCVCLPRFPSE